MTNRELVGKFCTYYFALQQIAINPNIEERIKDKFVDILDQIELEIKKNNGKIILPPQNTTLSPEPIIQFSIIEDSKEKIEQYTLNYTDCRLEQERVLSNIHSM